MPRRDLSRRPSGGPAQRPVLAQGLVSGRAVVGQVAVVVVDEVELVVFAALVVFAGLLAAVFVAPLPQPKEITAKHASADIAIKVLIVIK